MLQPTKHALSGPHKAIASHCLVDNGCASRLDLDSATHAKLPAATNPLLTEIHSVSGVPRSISFIRSTPSTMAGRSKKEHRQWHEWSDSREPPAPRLIERLGVRCDQASSCHHVGSHLGSGLRISGFRVFIEFRSSDGSDNRCPAEFPAPRM
jgi:hypothetical protein